ncbi:MAG: isochorismatase family protein [Streptosporangiaceae bacterium]
MTQTANAAAEEFYRSRGFGRPIGFGARPAIVVVDFINGFTDPALPYGAALDGEINATGRLLDAARAHGGVPIVFIVTAYELDDFSDAGLWKVKQAGITSLRAGTSAVEVDPRMGWRPGDEHRIAKKFASAFFGTDLVSRLNATSVDTILLAGCATSGCVRATAVDGLQNGYRVQVVREAVGDRDATAHERSLIEMDAKYADVISLDAAVTYLAGLPGGTA